MAYEPIRKYGDKDKLPSGDPGKVIYGAELDEEFDAISTEMENIETTIEEKWGEVTGDIPGIGKGQEDGETLMWNKGTQAWEKNDLLKVQPVDGEVVIDNMLVTQAVDGPTQTPVIGHHGMVYKAEKYDNANDPWSGVNGLDWEVGFIRPRDDGNNANRKNGYDVVSDRFTVRLTRDYSTTDWWETEIVFRADGDELELGSRQNPQTVKINGALTCTNSTELGNDNTDQHVLHGDVYVGYVDPNNVPDTAKGDTTPGTLFVSRGVKLVVDPASQDGQAPSFNCGGHKIVQLGDATSDDQAVNLGLLKDYAVRKNGSNVVQAADYDFSGRNYTVAEYIDNQLDANEAVYDELIKHSLQIEALQNSNFEALSQSSTFEEFKQKMVSALAEMIAESEKSKFKRPEK